MVGEESFSRVSGEDDDRIIAFCPCCVMTYGQLHNRSSARALQYSISESRRFFFLGGVTGTYLHDSGMTLSPMYFSLSPHLKIS